MKVQPLVSVLLPVHNGEKCVTKAIKSILDQDFRNFELIIVDDGSTDSTPCILRTFNDSRIKIITQRRQGIAKSLNTAIKASSSVYLARMDADDWAYPNRLRLQHSYLENNNNIGLVSALVTYDGNMNTQKGYFLYCQWINSLISPEHIYLNRFIESPMAHPTVMMRKSLITLFGGYNEGPVPEDYELWLRLLHNGVRMTKIDQALISWTDHQHRLSRTHSNYSSNSFYKIKTYYLHLWLNKKFGDNMPNIWVWGTGKDVYIKSSYINSYNISIKGYIEVKTGDFTEKKRKIIHYTNLPTADNTIILTYVSNRQGKEKIFDYLIHKGYKPGISFYMMA